MLLFLLNALQAELAYKHRSSLVWQLQKNTINPYYGRQGEATFFFKCLMNSPFNPLRTTLFFGAVRTGGGGAGSGFHLIGLSNEASSWITLSVEVHFVYFFEAEYGPSAMEFLLQLLLLL